MLANSRDQEGTARCLSMLNLACPWLYLKNISVSDEAKDVKNHKQLNALDH
jgi:hypothetical protein